MLDDYSLRLLAEIGIEIHLPQTVAARSAAGTVTADAAQGDALAPAAAAAGEAEVGIVCTSSSRTRLVEHLVMALRSARMRSTRMDLDAAGIAGMRGVVVFGEALARRLGAQLPAQRQAAIEWVVTGEPDELACSARAKRALWGEIKRLSRQLASNQIGGARH